MFGETVSLLVFRYEGVSEVPGAYLLKHRLLGPAQVSHSAGLVQLASKLPSLRCCSGAKLSKPRGSSDMLSLLRIMPS